jgi:hypothetical protein
VREEVIGQRFSELLGRLTFDEEVLAWVRDALRASHADEKREREAAMVRCGSNTTGFLSNAIPFGNCPETKDRAGVKI